MRKASLQDKKTLVDKVDCFIFDCDGVIWRGDSVIEGVPETLDLLRSMVRTLAPFPFIETQFFAHIALCTRSLIFGCC